MNRFADAYLRVLLPRRGRGGEAEAPDSLDVAVGAGWYRLVCAVETLALALRRIAGRVAGRVRTRPRPAPRTEPLGCG